MMGSYRAKNVSITELLKAHGRGLLPGLLDVDQGNSEAILRALNHWGWDTNLKLYLPFSEASGSSAFDISGEAHTGTITGTTVVSGVFGKARNFDGVDDYVSCGEIADMQVGTGPFSLELWLRGTGTGILIAAAWWDGVSGSSRVWLGTNAGQGEILINDGTTAVAAASTNTINDGTWHHVCGVRAGAVLTGYVDGQQADTTTGADLSLSDAGTFAVGRFGASPNYYWPGDIDEVRFYTRALTTDEIYLHYLAGALKLGLI